LAFWRLVVFRDVGVDIVLNLSSELIVKRYIYQKSGDVLQGTRDRSFGVGEESHTNINVNVNVGSPTFRITYR
jgi:hypothetical protein